MPSAMPGIMTGSILAMSRIMGEAAPLVVVGATAMILFDPEPLAALSGGNAEFTVIPIQIISGHKKRIQHGIQWQLQRVLR